MFTGIITDRFSNSWEKLAEIKDDESANCFICGQSREDIEKNEENFIEHINLVHNKLNYIFFIDFLKWKYEFALDSMTVNEMFVYNLICQKD